MKLLLVSCVIVLMGYHAQSAMHSHQDPRIVKTEQGSVEGTFGTTRGGRTYYAFKGIPYANFPGRFKHALEFASWSHVLPAKQFGEECANVDLFNLDSYKGSENCLFLNVFTPNPKPKAKYAVLFYIPGGALASSASNIFDGQYFLDEDIVVVSVSYRVGALGFFTFNTGLVEGIPGNLGLKDQSLALKWVQKNIQFFGGDPTKVTLAGFNGGAASAHHHVLSPMSAGLFRACIARGGTGVSFWAWQKHARKNAIKFTELIGCGTLEADNSNIKEVVKCLVELPVQAIVSAQIKMKQWHQYPLLLFTGQVEPVGGYGGHNFITEIPRKALKQGKHSYVPMMVGINGEEENLLAYPILSDKEKMTDLEDNFEKVAPIIFGMTHWGEEGWDVAPAVTKLKDLFFPNKAAEGITNKTLKGMLHDAYFHEPLDMVVRIHSTFAPVYPFVVSLKSDHSMMNYLYKLEGYHGLTHGDGLQFLFPGGGFGAPDYSGKTKHKDMMQFSKNFISMLASFVKDLKPERWDGKEWDPVVNQNRGELVEYLNIGFEINWLNFPGKIEHLGKFRKIRRWDIYDVNV